MGCEFAPNVGSGGGVRAEILIDTCLEVQPGWEVLVAGGVKGRALMEEISRQLARRGAYCLLRPRFSGTFIPYDWAREAPIARSTISNST